MIRELPPNSIDDVYRLPHDHSQQSDTFIDGASRAKFSHSYGNNEYVWMVKGPQLDVILVPMKCHNESPRLLCSFNFGNAFGDESLSIVNVCHLRDRFGVSHNDKYAYTLVVSLNRHSSGSLLCLFDVRLSAIIKSIECPFKVSCLETVMVHHPHNVTNWPLPNELMPMNGIISVGCCGGIVFFVDLGLDDETMKLSDGIIPKKVSFIVFNSSHQNIHAKRKASHVHDQLMCLPLNADAQHKGKFFYRTNDGKVLAEFLSSTVSVTAIHYIPQTAMICVGYNFSGFQLFNIKTFSIECSCSLDFGDCQLPPVLSFSFQEPENDPRNMTYLWLVRGYEYDDDTDNPLNSLYIDPHSTALMYVLCYDRKEWIPDYGFLYTNFQACECRFEYPFSTQPYYPNLNIACKSRLIDCYTINQGCFSSFKSDDDSDNCDLSLCIFSWEAWSKGNESSSVFFAIFDINQWYQSQMPSSVVVNEEAISFCPFLGIFSLMDIANRVSPDAILSINLDPETITKFHSQSHHHDLHYFPSSLSFSISVLSESQICRLTYYGLPKRVLSQMIVNGPNILIDPKEHLSQCIASGLISPELFSLTSTNASQRLLLLTLALENDALSFLIQVIQQWSTGELNHIGCNCKLILDWIWDRVSCIKSYIDRTTYSLFDNSGQILDELSIAQLCSYESDLESLGVLLKELQEHGTPTTDQGMLELGIRREICHMITIYLKILLWMHDSNLLPEHAENEAYGENEVAYPFSYFVKKYENFRNELHSIEPTVIKPTDLLMIDGLIANVNQINPKLSELWENGSGNGLYPPPNMHALIGIYLLESVSIEQKHAIMYYTLMDLASYLDERQTDIAERIRMYFPLTFGFNTGLTKLIHGLWALDHKDYNYAIASLLDPSVKSILNNGQMYDLFNTLQQRIVSSLLYRGEYRRALLYSQTSGHFTIDSPLREKMHITLLLMNQQISRAFEFQRLCRTEHNMEELLIFLYLNCERMELMEKLFKLPLDEMEEEALIYYLMSVSSAENAKQLLILYFILNNKIVDAANLFNQYQNDFTEIIDESLSQKTSKLISLIGAYISVLPQSLTKLAKTIYEIDEKKKHTKIGAKRPERVKTVKAKVEPKHVPSWIAPSHVIESVMEQIESVWTKEVPSPSKLSTPVTPFSEKFRKRNVLLAQNSPFLRTPISERRALKPKHISDASYPLISFDSPDIGINGIKTPLNKRSKQSEKSNLKTDSVASKKKQQKNVSADTSELFLLLQTPKIVKQKMHDINESIATDSSTSKSILKVKHTMRQSIRPSPPLPGSSKSAMRGDLSASQTRLRFAIPSSAEKMLEASQETYDMTDDTICAFGQMKDTFNLKVPMISSSADDSVEAEERSVTPLLPPLLEVPEEDPLIAFSCPILDPSSPKDGDLTLKGDETSSIQMSYKFSPPIRKNQSKKKPNEKTVSASKFVLPNIEEEKMNVDVRIQPERDTSSRTPSPSSVVEDSMSDTASHVSDTSLLSKPIKASQLPKTPIKRTPKKKAEKETPTHVMKLRETPSRSKSRSKTPTKDK